MKKRTTQLLIIHVKSIVTEPNQKQIISNICSTLILLRRRQTLCMVLNCRLCNNINPSRTKANKQMERTLLIFFLKSLSTAAKLNCKKIKDLCASLTQMQEHMLEDHCCNNCDQTFASRTEKLSHKKYMCKQCKITFSRSVELNIHKQKIFYMESAISKVTKQVPVTCSKKSKPPPCSDCQALQYKCTECSHQGEKEDNVINHIKNKYKAI